MNSKKWHSRTSASLCRLVICSEHRDLTQHSTAQSPTTTATEPNNFNSSAQWCNRSKSVQSAALSHSRLRSAAKADSNDQSKVKVAFHYANRRWPSPLADCLRVSRHITFNLLKTVNFFPLVLVAHQPYKINWLSNWACVPWPGGKRRL